MSTRSHTVASGLAEALIQKITTDALPEAGVRVLVGEIVQSVPESFNDWWQASKTAPDGPIDVIDIFSGCGGMSSGFRAVNGVIAAFRHILAIDIDQLANASYERNLKLKPVNADAHELATHPDQLRELIGQSSRRPGNPLILIGCAPCQGFSSIRNGAADDRNGLFVDFARIAVELMPDFVVIENVPELYTDHHWRRVEDAREILEEKGYRVHLAVHNFAEFGLPQERFRAVIIASRQPFSPPAGFLERSSFYTVRDAIGSLSPISPGSIDSSDPMHYTANHRKSTIDMIKTVPKNGGKRLFDTGPKSLIALHDRQGKPAYEDVYGRLHWDRPAITITASSRNPASGRFVHPDQDRGLSVREAALLQGFPADYEFVGSFDHRFQQIGNAVPPLVAANLALNLLAELLDPAPDGPRPGIQAPLARSFARLIPTLKSRKAHELTITGSSPNGASCS
jgi:DNA (cytosine-5)-methyltransferase 1